MQRLQIQKIILTVFCAVVLAPILGTAVLVVSGVNDHLGKAEIALVLGSKVELDGSPSPRLRARLDETLELYRAGCFPAVIVSGGTGKEGYDESVVMAGYLAAHGVPKESIILDGKGTTTFMSARNTLAIVHERKLSSVLVISQYFHVPRSRLALERFGIPTVYAAHAQFFEARDVYSSFREFFGYLSYLFRSYDPTVSSD